MKFVNSETSILESISDGVFTIDLEWNVTYFNRAAEVITGIPRSEAIGRKCWEVFRSSMCEETCALRETLATGKPVIGRSCYIIDARGQRVPISVSTAVLRDRDGKVYGGAETFRDLSELEALRKELEGKYRVGDLVSCSPLMQRIFEILPAIAESPSTVLILGETGTGKELVARAIHNLSSRRDGPFVAVNCGALPDTLLESELFGYKAGAFTGALKDKPGKFAVARGGTLFLDEIGEVTPALQVRLLRVLQERTYEPLGATKSEVADVRIIAATNRDLKALVKKGTFREDLYYRINVMSIELPPLRERKEDIPLLVDQFIRRFNVLHKKSIEGISPEALSLLMAHDWPGNVRELENVIERAFILCSGKTIEVSHIVSDFSPGLKHHSGNIKGIRETVEARLIEQTLRNTGYNCTETARRLGIHKATLYRKMKKLGIFRPGKAE
ncbi:sigma-54 interaction domain-containing protein [Thermodesulforhabdus norvegica]|uniref:PAS domain S-box-containing protein n=1 Tax=Thermodesulforhabdus norvegica TaxID=39841 RepID=A0A1I4R854_9BACT|nr:sigma 54-interacting transcriptional regulator [Thermodesulforhabdus norvegica]SFM48176.1 PAS domain S-box-containing protein [Thermodesulforhabdus norvegica]